MCGCLCVGARVCAGILQSSRQVAAACKVVAGRIEISAATRL